jgi:hypothetical protein
MLKSVVGVFCIGEEGVASGAFHLWNKGGARRPRYTYLHKLFMHDNNVDNNDGQDDSDKLTRNFSLKRF